MPDVSTEIRDWIPVIAGVLTAIAAAIGLPKILADRRARKAEAGEAPAPTSLLPSRITLVDRVTELAQIRRHLATDEPVVTVEGGRGVGKSALVLEAAHQFAAGGGGRRGGKSAKPAATLFWLDAGNDCPDIADVARKVGLYYTERSLTAAPMAEKKDALFAYLAANPQVLVVDDLRLHADEPAPLREFFQSLPSGSRAIISSNTVGTLAGPRVTVSELPEQDARALVVREAERCDVTDLTAADSPLVDRVHRLVGGNPRAIKVFIAACARQPGTVAELLDDIETGAGEMNTLYGVVWAELSERARATLSLCAFLGTADLGQVAIALDLPESDGKRALRQLWTDGLVESGQALGRTVYRCPPALRMFVLEHADAERLDQARDRLARSLAERFARDWENAAEAAAQVEVIRTLVQELADAGQHRLCLDLFAAVYDMLFTLALFDDRIKLGWVAFDAAGKLGSTEEQSLALSVVSSTHALRGEDAEAAHAAKMGLDVARKAGSAREIARQLRCEGFRRFRAGQATEALDAVLSEDAEEMARAAGDPNNMIDILSLIGAAQFHLGDFDGCETTVRRFLSECEDMPWERGKAYALRDLAEARQMRGDQRAADDLVTRAKAIATEYRDARQLARIGLTEARVHLFAGRMRLARATASQAASAAGELLLRGEQAEAEAVAALATRCLWMPWRRRTVVGKPRNRFTDWTIGGD